ncbi:hypothetical protein VFPPC_15285 [Pochonia chlamydosporia 170]|uniref:Uncharacterized protein n=1 Tax=Pochonia chlamydosporia 170 TaxID=1380566 RepID=A0A179G6Z9_METCM|nr:hypothetical protein VFPPC_15285 [Pochonia chlamydosporia 170]OAQ73318.1 hypothetical protein VFPPC_15285 [Pochonia chlamydosporia 170]
MAVSPIRENHNTLNEKIMPQKSSPASQSTHCRNVLSCTAYSVLRTGHIKPSTLTGPSGKVRKKLLHELQTEIQKARFDRYTGNSIGLVQPPPRGCAGPTGLTNETISLFQVDLGPAHGPPFSRCDGRNIDRKLPASPSAPTWPSSNYVVCHFLHPRPTAVPDSTECAVGVI